MSKEEGKGCSNACDALALLADIQKLYNSLVSLFQIESSNLNNSKVFRKLPHPVLRYPLHKSRCVKVINAEWNFSS